MIYFWLLGLALISLIAMILPVSLPSVNFLNAYFWAAVALAGMALSPWVYLQARLAPQLRQNSRGRTAVYLLAGYLFIFGIYVAWPYTFVRIIEARISSKISESEFRSDMQTFEKSIKNNNINSTENRRLALKYRNISQINAANLGDVYFGLLNTLHRVSVIKGGGGVVAQNSYDRWVVVPQIVLLLALLLRSLQVSGMKSLITTLLFVAAFCITMILYTDSSRFDDVFFEGTIFLFLIGIYAAFRAPSLKTKNALFVVGINIFTLLLAWMPCLPLLFSDETFGLDRLYFKLFSLGVVILFAVAPWAQRRYLALQAKPS